MVDETKVAVGSNKNPVDENASKGIFFKEKAAFEKLQSMSPIIPRSRSNSSGYSSSESTQDSGSSEKLPDLNPSDSAVARDVLAKAGAEALCAFYLQSQVQTYEAVCFMLNYFAQHPELLKSIIQKKKNDSEAATAYAQLSSNADLKVWLDYCEKLYGPEEKVQEQNTAVNVESGKVKDDKTDKDDKKDSTVQVLQESNTLDSKVVNPTLEDLAVTLQEQASVQWLRHLESERKGTGVNPAHLREAISVFESVYFGKKDGASVFSKALREDLQERLNILKGETFPECVPFFSKLDEYQHAVETRNIFKRTNKDRAKQVDTVRQAINDFYATSNAIDLITQLTMVRGELPAAKSKYLPGGSELATQVDSMLLEALTSNAFTAEDYEDWEFFRLVHTLDQNLSGKTSDKKLLKTVNELKGACVAHGVAEPKEKFRRKLFVALCDRKFDGKAVEGEWAEVAAIINHPQYSEQAGSFYIVEEFIQLRRNSRDPLISRAIDASAPELLALLKTDVEWSNNKRSGCEPGDRYEVYKMLCDFELLCTENNVPQSDEFAKMHKAFVVEDQKKNDRIVYGLLNVVQQHQLEARTRWVKPDVARVAQVKEINKAAEKFFESNQEYKNFIEFSRSLISVRKRLPKSGSVLAADLEKFLQENFAQENSQEDARSLKNDLLKLSVLVDIEVIFERTGDEEAKQAISARREDILKAIRSVVRTDTEIDAAVDVDIQKINKSTAMVIGKADPGNIEAIAKVRAMAEEKIDGVRANAEAKKARSKAIPLAVNFLQDSTREQLRYAKYITSGHRAPRNSRIPAQLRALDADAFLVISGHYSDADLFSFMQKMVRAKDSLKGTGYETFLNQHIIDGIAAIDITKLNKHEKLEFFERLQNLKRTFATNKDYTDVLESKIAAYAKLEDFNGRAYKVFSAFYAYEANTRLNRKLISNLKNGIKQKIIALPEKGSAEWNEVEEIKACNSLRDYLVDEKKKFLSSENKNKLKNKLRETFFSGLISELNEGIKTCEEMPARFLVDALSNKIEGKIKFLFDSRAKVTEEDFNELKKLTSQLKEMAEQLKAEGFHTGQSLSLLTQRGQCFFRNIKKLWATFNEASNNSQVSNTGRITVFNEVWTALSSVAPRNVLSSVLGEERFVAGKINRELLERLNGIYEDKKEKNGVTEKNNVDYLCAIFSLENDDFVKTSEAFFRKNVDKEDLKEVMQAASNHTGRKIVILSPDDDYFAPVVYTPTKPPDKILSPLYVVGASSSIYPKAAYPLSRGDIGDVSRYSGLSTHESMRDKIAREHLIGLLPTKNTENVDAVVKNFINEFDKWTLQLPDVKRQVAVDAYDKFKSEESGFNVVQLVKIVNSLSRELKEYFGSMLETDYKLVAGRRKFGQYNRLQSAQLNASWDAFLCCAKSKAGSYPMRAVGLDFIKESGNPDFAKSLSNIIGSPYVKRFLRFGLQGWCAEMAQYATLGSSVPGSVEKLLPEIMGYYEKFEEQDRKLSPNLVEDPNVSDQAMDGFKSQLLGDMQVIARKATHLQPFYEILDKTELSVAVPSSSSVSSTPVSQTRNSGFFGNRASPPKPTVESAVSLPVLSAEEVADMKMKRRIKTTEELFAFIKKSEIWVPSDDVLIQEERLGIFNVTAFAEWMRINCYELLGSKKALTDLIDKDETLLPIHRHHYKTLVDSVMVTGQMPEKLSNNTESGKFLTGLHAFCKEFGAGVPLTSIEFQRAISTKLKDPKFLLESVSQEAWSFVENSGCDYINLLMSSDNDLKKALAKRSHEAEADRSSLPEAEIKKARTQYFVSKLHSEVARAKNYESHKLADSNESFMDVWVEKFAEKIKETGFSFEPTDVEVLRHKVKDSCVKKAEEEHPIMEELNVSKGIFENLSEKKDPKEILQELNVKGAGKVEEVKTVVTAFAVTFDFMQKMVALKKSEPVTKARLLELIDSALVSQTVFTEQACKENDNKRWYPMFTNEQLIVVGKCDGFWWNNKPEAVVAIASQPLDMENAEKFSIKDLKELKNVRVNRLASENLLQQVRKLAMTESSDQLVLVMSEIGNIEMSQFLITEKECDELLHLEFKKREFSPVSKMLLNFAENRSFNGAVFQSNISCLKRIASQSNLYGVIDVLKTSKGISKEILDVFVLGGVIFKLYPNSLGFDKDFDEVEVVYDGLFSRFQMNAEEVFNARARLFSTQISCFSVNGDMSSAKALIPGTAASKTKSIINEKLTPKLLSVLRDPYLYNGGRSSVQSQNRLLTSLKKLGEHSSGDDRLKSLNNNSLAVISLVNGVMIAIKACEEKASAKANLNELKRIVHDFTNAVSVTQLPKEFKDSAYDACKEIVRFYLAPPQASIAGNRSSVLRKHGNDQQASDLSELHKILDAAKDGLVVSMPASSAQNTPTKQSNSVPKTSSMSFMKLAARAGEGEISQSSPLTSQSMPVSISKGNVANKSGNSPQNSQSSSLSSSTKVTNDLLSASNTTDLDAVNLNSHLDGLLKDSANSKLSYQELLDFARGSLVLESQLVALERRPTDDLLKRLHRPILVVDSNRKLIPYNIKAGRECVFVYRNNNGQFFLLLPSNPPENSQEEIMRAFSEPKKVNAPVTPTAKPVPIVSPNTAVKADVFSIFVFEDVVGDGKTWCDAVVACSAYRRAMDTSTVEREIKNKTNKDLQKIEIDELSTCLDRPIVVLDKSGKIINCSKNASEEEHTKKPISTNPIFVVEQSAGKYAFLRLKVDNRTMLYPAVLDHVIKNQPQSAVINNNVETLQQSSSTKITRAVVNTPIARDSVVVNESVVDNEKNKGIMQQLSDIVDEEASNVEEAGAGEEKGSPVVSNNNLSNEEVFAMSVPSSAENLSSLSGRNSTSPVSNKAMPKPSLSVFLEGVGLGDVLEEGTLVNIFGVPADHCIVKIKPDGKFEISGNGDSEKIMFLYVNEAENYSKRLVPKEAHKGKERDILSMIEENKSMQRENNNSPSPKPLNKN